MKTIYYFIFLSLLLNESYSQGCVAVRHVTCGSQNPANALQMNNSQEGINFGISYRWFESDRHFRGDHEESERFAQNTEVINSQHSTDLFLNYNMNKQSGFNLIVPFVYNTRSSLYEHGFNERHTTASNGIGDIRLSAFYWLNDFDMFPDFNISFGFGVKLPTGNFNSQDYFYNVGDENGELRTVDQSIQPGDGGFGFNINLQYYYLLSDDFSLFGNLFYMFNPQNMNSVRTYRDELGIPNETIQKALELESLMSIPDQYFTRIGIQYQGLFLDELGASLGLRAEGIPVSDLLGASDGFRRPGVIVSIEPGLNFMDGVNNLNLSFPIAVYRNRYQSLTDQRAEELYNIERHGDAAFADYAINLSYSFRMFNQQAQVSQ